MDPISILSIVGAALSVANGVTKAIGMLSELKSRYRNVPLQLSTVIGQLYIVRAALDQISSLSSGDLFSDPRYQQLAAQIGTALDSFRPLISALQKHLDELGPYEGIAKAGMEKASFLWNEQELMAYSSLLDCQVNALSLFLQAVQWYVSGPLRSVCKINDFCSKTLADQQNLVNDEDSQVILKKARDYSASIIGMSDSSSILSDCTNTNTLGLEFDFDASLLGSQAYRSAHRSNLRQLTTIAKATEPDYQLLYSARQQHPVAVLQLPLEESSSAFEISGSDLPLLDYGHGSNYHNESSTSELDQDTDQFSHFPMGNDKMGSPPHPPPSTAHKSATAPIPVDKAVDFVSSGSMLPHKRDSALMVRSPSSTSINEILAPKSTLLRSLRKYWRSRTANEPANGSNAWGPLAAKQNTVSPTSTCTPMRKQEVKMLILGSSESGKTTLLKDMRLYTGGGYTREERICFAEINRTNLVQGIRVILEAMESMEIPFQYKENEHHAEMILIQESQAKGGYPGYPAEVATSITELWADAGVQEAFRRRHEYQLSDNISHFASHVHRLIAPGYIPSQADILRSRVKTTGVTETSIHLYDKILRVSNVGGVRAERKKWIHTFENVDSIIFTVDASAYCRRLFEDERVNRMQEQLDLWESIANSRWFTEVDLVLVFTKVDTLLETIELSPISKYFPEFGEPVETVGIAQLIESYLAFLEERFISLIASEEARQRTKVVFADLVHIEDRNPAGLVLENLKLDQWLRCETSV